MPISKELLQDCIDKGFSTLQISHHTGYSPNAVQWWLKKYELKTVHKCRRQGPGKPFLCACGENRREQFHPSKPQRCKKCHNDYFVERSRTRKRLLVKHMGGKCVKCGYNKCIAAMDFHHINPQDKDPEWQQFRSRKLEAALKELEKCELVCKNCHAEIHYGEGA